MGIMEDGQGVVMEQATAVLSSFFFSVFLANVTE
jgi:hypothetical protein